MPGPQDTTTKRLTERSDGQHLDNDGVIYEEEIRYCWIDEDGARVSPVHKDFGKAISWVSDWPTNWARINERVATVEERYEEASSMSTYHARELDQLRGLRAKLSVTGKPPATLRRLVIRTTSESIVDHEVETVAHVLSRAGLT